MNHMRYFLMLYLLISFCLSGYAEVDYGQKDISGQGSFIASSTAPGRKLALPWLNDNTEKTMFGFRFKEPVEVGKVVVRWSEFVPKSGHYFLGYVDADGKMVYIPIDNSRSIFPLDSSTFIFKPIKAREVLILTTASKLTGTNYIGCDKLEIYPPASEPPRGINHWRWYQCGFDSKTGAITGLGPDTAYFGLGIGPWYPPLALFHRIGMVYKYKGKEILPTVGMNSIRSGSIGSLDWIEFSADFMDENSIVATGEVKLIFKPGFEQPLSFTYRVSPSQADKGSAFVVLQAEEAPFKGRGYKVLCRKKALLKGQFQAEYESDEKLLLEVDAPALFESHTAAGKVRITFKGARSLTLHHYGLEQAKRLGLKRPFLRFAAELSPDKIMNITISLPVGIREEQPAQRFRFRPLSRPVYEIDSVGVFSKADLELVESIDFADPADGHEIYDASDDPAFNDDYIRRYVNPKLVAERKRHASFVTEILGRKCRVTTGIHGSYFRCVLKETYERETYYLLVLEYPDDVRRGGVLTGVTGDGGIDTGPEPHSMTFKRQAYLFIFGGPLMPPPEKPWVAFVNWGTRDHGIAISRVWVYKVRTMPKLPDLTVDKSTKRKLHALYPPPEKQRYVGGYAQLFSPYLFRDKAPMVGFNWVYFNQDPHILINRRWYATPSLMIDAGYHPGSLHDWDVILSRAETAGVAVKIYLSQLLKLGYDDVDRDAFVRYGCYNQDSLPISLQADEWQLVKKALNRSLRHLSKYQSMRFIAVCQLIPHHVFSLRNLRDFTKETGVSVPQTTNWQQARDYIYEHPDVRLKWSKWACLHRFRFYRRLQDIIRKHRRDLVLVLTPVSFVSGVYDLPWYEKDGEYRKKMEALGIHSVVEVAKTLGLDPELYKNQRGFMLEVCGGGAAIGDPASYPTEYFNTWDDPAMKHMMDCFPEGSMAWIPLCFAEGGASPGMWTNPMFECPEVYRKTLIDAVIANLRVITLGSYGVPWYGLMWEFRQFAVPFRMLPFGKPEPFKGTVEPKSDNLIVRRFEHHHYAVINRAAKPVTLRLSIPAKKGANLYDLSNGIPEKITKAGADGKLQIKLEMLPFSLRTLAAL